MSRENAELFVINLLKPNGKYMYQQLQQQVSLHFVFWILYYS
jgi:hypothetical protein